MDCYATLEFLIAHFPFVSVKLRGVWRVTVAEAPSDGLYAVSLNEVEYSHTAQPGDDASSIRGGVVSALAGQTLVAVAPYGPRSVDLTENAVGSIEEISVAGPTEPDFSLEPKVPQNNHEYLELLLEATKCGVNCCAFGCDSKLYHAALTAHMFGELWGTSANGISPSEWTSMKLGPATIAKGNAAANLSKSDLKGTAPGRLVLMLRKRHISKVVCR